jgi:hypothetical protein
VYSAYSWTLHIPKYALHCIFGGICKNPLYGDGVSIVPNVCLEWVEQPEPSGSASGIRRGNTFESQTLRGRETVLEALKSTVRTCECMSARTGDKLRAISEVSPTDIRNSRMESRIHRKA